MLLTICCCHIAYGSLWLVKKNHSHRSGMMTQTPLLSATAAVEGAVFFPAFFFVVGLAMVELTGHIRSQFRSQLASRRGYLVPLDFQGGYRGP